MPGISGRFAAALAAAVALGGCMLQAENSLNAELTRLTTLDPVHVIDAAPEHVVFGVRGRNLALVPVEGFCISRDTVEVDDQIGFALMAECLPDDFSIIDGELPDQKPLQSPKAVNLITTSVMGRRLAAPDGTAQLTSFLLTAAGKELLGRGTAGADALTINDMRAVGGALYVQVEEQDRPGLGIFAPQYWRAFVEVNERLVSVTVSQLGAGQADDDGMLALLALQIAQLRASNNMPVVEEELRLADGAGRGLRVANLPDLGNVRVAGPQRVRGSGLVPAQRGLGEVSREPRLQSPWSLAPDEPPQTDNSTQTGT